ncbi:M81 family metallopeptidase [Prosthecobacter sp.]|uniref:M81 family metallopeptidase n=1 Tax=Prosthecobacter sp. TaxID=1965333 RepID=UPI001DA5A76A|nr:M81 family metallopeptidase [Prosthecobacter sp.]MCB1276498.1 M81 family metallopeptidase [Prosthecobacter sp.]
MPRILIAGLFHETHTFLDGLTMPADFQIRRGEELFSCTGDASPLGGVLELAEEFGWEMVPAADYRAQPSATVADEVIEQFWADIAPAVRAGCDAIYLVLHGAMTSQTILDVEGEILRRIRAITGVPIFGVFDLHANFSPQMAELADCLVAYRENPHTDAREAGLIAARLLNRCLTTGDRPRMQLKQPGIIWPPTGTGTASDPMLSLEEMAREFEHDDDSLWSMSIVAGFSFADTPDTGVSFVACTTGDAKAQLESLAQRARELASLGQITDPSADEVLAGLKPPPHGLTVLVEPSDNIGGGAPGDCTGLLRALIRHGIVNAAICLCDPQAVCEIEAGSRHISLGGKGSRLDAGPVELDVELVALNDGRFELEDKNSHLASMCGDVFDMGRCAVVKHAGITILITSVKTPPFDLGQWHSQGVAVEELSIVAVKAAVAHRRAYDKIAARMLWVDTPGPCSSNLKALPYKFARVGG